MLNGTLTGKVVGNLNEYKGAEGLSHWFEVRTKVFFAGKLKERSYMVAVPTYQTKSAERLVKDNALVAICYRDCVSMPADDGGSYVVLRAESIDYAS